MIEDSDEFFEKYKPAVPKEAYTCGSMTNDDDEHISYCISTDWSKIAFPINHQPSDFIWTVCHVDDATYICQGFQFVNRAYYLMATVPYQEGDKDTYCYMASDEDFNEVS